MIGGLPLVSVMIPTYNSRRTLVAAIESVRMQEVGDWELLVVGDGCTDDSAEVVAAVGDPRVTWIGLERNSGGPSRPRNEGLRRARGRYVAHLGHDDLWFPWHLRVLAEAIETSGAAMVSSLGAYLEPRGASTAFGLPAGARTLAPLSPSTWLHRAELVLEWAERLAWGHEVYVADRIAALRVRTLQVDELTASKFPALSWRSYGKGAATPQVEALAAIKADAREYQRHLLHGIAGQVAGALVLSGQSRHSLLARAAFAVLVGWLRPYRWPLDRLLRRRHRRLAGLPPG